jgi:hypothetical protein
MMSRRSQRLSPYDVRRGLETLRRREKNWVNEAQCIHHTFSTLIKHLMLDAK